jgi:putative hydrolase of the HAD superfamily
VIKAVIFDCFGVLTSDGWKQIREEYFAHDEQQMQHALDIDRAVNAGYMEFKAFTKEISGMTGLTQDEVIDRIGKSVPNTILLTYIRDELKPRFQIGMLSNAADNWLDVLFEPAQLRLFDQIVLSYQIGAVKPDPAAYQAITNKLGVLPEECIFVDDQQRYCTAAEDLGMKAIYHDDTHQTIARLKELAHA